jgi:hypothetical protein
MPFDRSPHEWKYPVVTLTNAERSHCAPAKPDWQVQLAVPLVSEQVPRPLHAVGEKVAHVWEQVPLLSLSWNPAAQVVQVGPPYPVEQVHVGVPVESVHVPRPPHDARVGATHVAPQNAEPAPQPHTN